MRTVGICGIAALLPLIALSVLPPPLRAFQMTLSGHVVDENEAPVRGAQVTVRAAGLPANPPQQFQAITGPNGAFTISLPRPGDFLVSVEREGYYALTNRPLRAEAGRPVTLVVNSVREVFQSENVNEATSPLETAAAQNQERLSGTEVNDMPYANSHSLRNALQLMPDVVEDQTGALHVNGSSESQVLYLLNGFNLSNPISGQFQTLLAVEGIRSVDLSSGRYSPEFGKGSAGVLAINTENGTDKLHYTATDFIPGLSIQQGLRLANWYPRFGMSGPIVKGKAWFSDTFDAEYTQALVTGLPGGQNTRSGLAIGNLLHTQFNLNQSNILFADFLVNVDNEGRVGLGPLNPVSTTSNVDTREYFGSIKDQVYFGHGLLVEFGYGHNDFSTAQRPQGQGLYVFTPQGNSGNYFVNGAQRASRDQGLVHAYLPQFQLAGAHQIEAGGGGDRLLYNGDFHRTGYEVFGNSGQLISETLFPTPAVFHTGDTEASSWVLDTWRVSQKLQLTPGFREDWDQRLGTVAWSPHLGFSWSPFKSGRTRISGGYALTHDALTMDILGRPLDQAAITTHFNPDGAPAGPPASTTFAIGNSRLVLPRATNWNLDFDRQVSAHIYASAKYLRRRGTDEFAFINTAAPNAPPSLLPLPNADAPGVYQLANARRDDYDSVQLSIRQTLSGQYEWMAAYTRSRALSNAVLDPNVAQPLQVLPNLVPMIWDSPNRFLAWAYLPLPFRSQSLLLRNWAISGLVNMRTGFPFSVRDQAGTVVGTVDFYRYPLNFDLNLAIERMVTLRGYRFALRGGVDNLTDQANPTAVNNVIGAPQYLRFLGDEGRHFVVRIRFFGRAEAPPVTPRRSPSSSTQPAIAPPQTPSAVPQNAAPAQSATPDKAASIYGNTGLWKVFTAGTLSRHQFALSTWYDRINRNPGDLVVSTFGFGGAIGLTDRLELGISLEANRDVTTGRPDELSFGQEALGFFGDKTPGSPPLASELMPGSSKVPQLRYPATPTGALTGAAGYFNLYPFAGLVSSGSAMGDALFGLKIRLLSESDGAPFGLAIRPYFDLPIHKAITFLETHPVGTADLQGGVDGIVSKDVGGAAELFLNAGYRYISQPAHISVFQLSKDLPLGFGVTAPRSARIQFVAESTADVFVGAHTPNTTFGAEDPVDLTIGFRGYVARSLIFSAGYRRPLNQFGGDKNGFVVSLGYTRR